MKQIILDYYRRRWLAFVPLLIGHLSLELLGLGHFVKQRWPAAASFYPHREFTTAFSCNILLFLGIMLVGDLARGQARILALLPLPRRQSGRALWIASVLIPGLTFAMISAVCDLQYSNGSFREVFMPAQLRHWATMPLVLGGIFASQTIASALQPTSVPGLFCKAVMILGGFALSVGGWYYLQGPSIHPISTAFTIIVLAALSIVGWLRAGQLIGFQASQFRLSTSTPTPIKKSSSNTGTGVGGLRYLLQRTFLRSVLIPLGLCLSIVAFFSFTSGSLQPLGADITTLYVVMAPLILILMMEIFPVTQQLRFLRTLPISPSLLAGILTFLPSASLLTVGTILTFFVAPEAGIASLLPFIKFFLTLAAIAALGQVILVWIGFDTLGYLLVLALLGSVSMFSIKMPIEIPPSISIALPILLIALSYFLTRWLVSRSSIAYRIRPGILNSDLTRPS